MKFPALAATVTSYLKANGCQAHLKRKDNIAVRLSMETSLNSLKKHVKEEIQGLVISTNLLGRLFKPPNTSRSSSRFYKALINASVASKKNACQKGHPDDKAKIKVGALAVSRYFQLRKFCMDGDLPDFSDHDSPS